MQSLFNDWMKVINPNLLLQILKSIDNVDICPQKQDVFNAFKLCSLEDCKVVFLGQDPYPQRGVATGILFGNRNSVKEEDLSPSLQIIKEAVIDYTKPHNVVSFDNTLESWARQGILMINSALTVEVNKIGSHTNIWRPFIAQLLQNLSSYHTGILYVLFGQQAQTFEPYIKKENNHILKENHPAFYARSKKRMPSDVFFKINTYLCKQYNQTIEWYKEEVF